MREREPDRESGDSGFDVLERFGAAIEAAFGEADVLERPAPPVTETRPTPAAPTAPAAPPLSGAALDAEVERRLMEQGVVVRGQDIARVVSLMSGVDVVWK